ncbi:MAG: choice-of-anchor D domain-containing protein [Alphaproteobacteria bacterium]|nr:choice-of-anchor D domain-containing protein [Alphaproteobacteria bacterium]
MGFVFGVLFCSNRETNIGVAVDEPPDVRECFGMVFPDPGNLDFGSVPVGGTPEETLLLLNEGGCLAQVLSLSWADGSGPFEFDPPESMLIPEGDVLPLTVRFSPEEPGDYEGALWVETDLGDVWEISVTGQGYSGQPEVTPEAIAFESVAVGCSVSETFTLTNAGNSRLEVRSASGLEGTPFALEDELPVALDEAESHAFTVTFRPTEGGAYEEVLHLVLDDAVVPDLDLAITAEALDEAPVERRRTWRADTPADLLLAVSTTESMAPHLDDLDDGFPAMLDALDATGVDWQVGIVTQDGGCVLGETPVVHPGQSAGLQEATLRTMLWSPPESGSEDARRPLALASAALSADNIGAAGCNEGLRRDGATLGIIGVINGPDQSPDPVADYLATFEAVAGEPDLLTVHGVGAPDGGCNGIPFSAGLAEAIEETGGALYPICASDLGEGLDWVARRAVADPLRFYLPEEPEVFSLTVEVDGAPLSAGWSWDATLNAVIFDISPEDGAEVVVRYQPLEDCEG